LIHHHYFLIALPSLPVGRQVTGNNNLGPIHLIFSILCFRLGVPCRRQENTKKKNAGKAGRREILIHHHYFLIVLPTYRQQKF